MAPILPVLAARRSRFELKPKISDCLRRVLEAVHDRAKRIGMATFADQALRSGFRFATAPVCCIYVVSTSRRSVMIVEFCKWGNSLAVRIPKALADIIKVSDAKRADIKIEKGALLLPPIVNPARKPSYTLDELLGGMTKDDVPEEIDWGSKRGNEAW